MTPRGHHHHSRLFTARRERCGREREKEARRRERERRDAAKREKEERGGAGERESRRLGLSVSGNSLQGFASKLLMRGKGGEGLLL